MATTAETDGSAELSPRAWSFVVPGRLITWKRTTSVRMPNGKVRRPNRAEMKAAKEAIGWRAVAARPQGWPLGRRYALGVLVHLRNHSGEGDLDRYINLVMDALQGVVYANDRQVDEFFRCAKLFGDGEPRTEVTIATTEGS